MLKKDRKMWTCLRPDPTLRHRVPITERRRAPRLSLGLGHLRQPTFSVSAPSPSHDGIVFYATEECCRTVQVGDAAWLFLAGGGRGSRR